MRLFIDVLGKFEKYLLGYLLMTLLVLALLQVFSRYVLQTPLRGTEELARMVLIGLAFIGGGLGLKNRAHIQLDVMDAFVKKKKTKAVIDLIAEVLTTSFLVAFLGYSYKFMAYAIQSGQITIALEVPLFIPMGTLFVGALLMVIHNLVNIIDDVIKFINMDKTPGLASNYNKGA